MFLIKVSKKGNEEKYIPIILDGCFFLRQVTKHSYRNVSLFLHEYSSWKWKIPIIIVQFQMCLFSDWHVIKHFSYNTNDYLK